MTTSDVTTASRVAVEVSDLSVAAGEAALVSDVSFTLRAGQRVGLIGASGSGKTVTATAISGLLSADLTVTGSVRFAGSSANLLDLSEKEVATRRGLDVGMVFQEPMTALNPTMRVGRQIAEALKLHGAARTGRARDQAGALLREVGLSEPDIAGRYPHELSGGQRQRVMLAIALANRPQLLICDEPTTALDVSTQAQVIDLIDRRCTETGAALLFISHNLAVVTALCDDVLVMCEGRVVERGPVLDVLDNPRHPHTRSLLEGAAGPSSEATP